MNDEKTLFPAFGREISQPHSRSIMLRTRNLYLVDIARPSQLLGFYRLIRQCASSAGVPFSMLKGDEASEE